MILILGAAGAGSPFDGSSSAETARASAPKLTPGAVPSSLPLTAAPVKSGENRSALPRACPSAHKAVRFYQRRYFEHLAKMGAGRSTVSVVREPRGLRSCPRYLSHLWKRKAYAMRLRVERWKEKHTLRDFPFSPGGRAWHRAVRESQKVFPGTEGWLLSCSAAEGGHGRWVGYAGVGYSTGLRDSDTVGGPMQYRFSTFTGHFRHALEYVREHRYFVPRSLYDRTNAWTSALGQALAGGWARYTGNDNSHWQASWGNGC